MQTSDTQKNFQRFEGPLGDARRHVVTLDLDEQVYLFLSAWATAQRLTVPVLLERAATQLAGKLTADTFSTADAARALRIYDLDLDDLKDRDHRSAAAPVACGNLANAQAPATPAGDAENERRTEILDYYQKLTGNRIKARDYAALKSVFDLPDLVIHAGILHALCYASRRVGSFAYCVKAMDNFLDVRIDLEEAISALGDKLLDKRSRGQLVLPLEGETLLIGEFQKCRL